MPFTAMEPFDLYNLQAAIEGRVSKTMWCYPNEIKAISELLQDANIHFWTAWGSKPDMIRARVASNPTKDDKTRIRVRVVPYNALELQAFCDRFMETCGWLRLVYTGESQSVVFLKAINALFTSRRLYPHTEIKENILKRQNNLCAKCCDPLSSPEFDHVSPLCLGGAPHPGGQCRIDSLGWPTDHL
jgi:hypothetical protein